MVDVLLDFPLWHTVQEKLTSNSLTAHPNQLSRPLERALLSIFVSEGGGIRREGEELCKNAMGAGGG